MHSRLKITRFIKSYESLHDGDLSTISLEPKPDARGIWTEGYGKAMTRNGKFMTVKDYPTVADILPYRTITTEAEAMDALEEELDKFADGVMKRLSVSLPQHKFDALLSHAYNCGFSDTLYKLVNTNAPEAEIKEWFTTKYITGGGIPLKGLVLRRLDEYEMWLNANYERDYLIREIKKIS